MKTLEIKNEYIIGILDTFLQSLLAVDRSVFPYGVPDITPEYACSQQYLDLMQDKRVTGYPEKTFGVDLMKYRSPYQSLIEATRRLDTDLLAWAGSRNNAVKMLYPKGGYMGWHHNANAPGYNILLSWSKDGLGYFRYQDPVTKEHVTLQDKPGWTCKVGYYGAFADPSRVYWHCASAEHEERVTLGYIIPHEALWENMCEDIQLK